MAKPKTSTLGDLKKILKQLKEANDPLDKDLIEFYTKKIATETEKALKRITIKSMLTRPDK